MEFTRAFRFLAFVALTALLVGLIFGIGRVFALGGEHAYLPLVFRNGTPIQPQIASATPVLTETTDPTATSTSTARATST